MATSTFNINRPMKQIQVSRHYDVPADSVWAAWTHSDLLDSWWAPKPFKASTRSFEFRESGYWLYSMNGPDGEKQWCRMDYTHIGPEFKFTAYGAFCDENGTLSEELPRHKWKCTCIPEENGTRLDNCITFNSEEDLDLILSLGFQEGFASALDNLNEVVGS